MSEQMVIQSHRGPYTVHFADAPLIEPESLLSSPAHFLIDATVARLYRQPLRGIVDHPNTLVIEATEGAKSLQGTIPVFEHLVERSVRRDQRLVAIGGGIVQDICCFVASTLLRGLPWQFVPTTLLAQADSCIGSKSSINLGPTKNVLGTFNPPEAIFVHRGFLETLQPQDVRSGIGEIIKVHAIDGVEAFDALASDYDRMLHDPLLLQQYIVAALQIKRRFIEEDEFDRGPRNIFNYGHSFGHAIESATGYAVPHGIAISIGMDLANHVAVERGLLPRAHYARMHVVLRKNYASSLPLTLDTGRVLSALLRDKKNTSTALRLILPAGDRARIEPVLVPPDDVLQSQCAAFLEGLA